jgi:hypothetical protein
MVNEVWIGIPHTNNEITIKWIYIPKFTNVYLYNVNCDVQSNLQQFYVICGPPHAKIIDGNSCFRVPREILASIFLHTSVGYGFTVYALKEDYVSLNIWKIIKFWNQRFSEV